MASKATSLVLLFGYHALLLALSDLVATKGRSAYAKSSILPSITVTRDGFPALARLIGRRGIRCTWKIKQAEPQAQHQNDTLEQLHLRCAWQMTCAYPIMPPTSASLVYVDNSIRPPANSRNYCKVTPHCARRAKEAPAVGVGSRMWNRTAYSIRSSGIKPIPK